MLDLVHMHCAVNTKLINVPNGVNRNENGNVKLGPYKIPLLNFESRVLREYLIENMRYFINDRYSLFNKNALSMRKGVNFINGYN